MELAHTILAMVGTRPVRVQCNTCNGQHNYRRVGDEPAEPRSPRSPKAASSRPVTARLTFDEVMAKKGGVARAYSPKTSFGLDDVVAHPVFGRGFVSAVRNDKIDVTFAGGVKTLVHARA